MQPDRQAFHAADGQWTVWALRAELIEEMSGMKHGNLS